MTTLMQQSQQRLLVRAVFISAALLILVTGIAIGLAIRQFGASAAPGDVTACVNRYTGSVRMNPYGTTNCTPNETEVTWPGIDTTGLRNLYVKSSNAALSGGGAILTGVECDEGTVAVGGGFSSDLVSDLRVTVNSPGDDPRTWLVGVVNEGAASVEIVAYAKCATP